MQNGLKCGDALSPLLFNFALEYAIRNAQEKQVKLKLKGNFDTSEEVGLEMNVMKTKLSHNQYAGENHYIKIADRSFKKYGHPDIWEQQ
jgi:hypothetical protein